jgi:polysaccharide export outer membrane protein
MSVFFHSCRGRLASLMALSGIFFIGSCVAQAQQPPAATSPQTSPSASADAPPPDSGQSDHYIIGPGDTLQVFVWRNPELSQLVPVRPDGKISTPLVENMDAAGKTPSNLARDIEKVLSEYVRSPKVNIIVTVPVSTFSQVRVVGQVAHPQGLAFREGMTVMDVILQVGGLTEFASGARAKVVRTENGKEHEIRVNLTRLLNNGDLKQNVPLKPGDVVVVPQSLF